MLAREGWLVVAGCAGSWGYGDCAPLPEAGTESLETAWRALSVWRDRLPGQSIPEALESFSGTAAGSPPPPLLPWNAPCWTWKAA